MSALGAHNQQQQQEQQQQQQQHDVDSLLGLVLDSLESREGQACACALHRASSSSRSTAVATLKHLPLSRYHHGRARALQLVHKMEPGSIPPAAARAAAVPPLPRPLLADVVAAGALTSLDISAPQIQHLLAGNPTAAAAAVPGLAATLSRLRCLRVADILIEEPPQLQQVGRLVGACSGLTRLVLAATEWSPDELKGWFDGYDCGVLDQGLKLAAAVPVEGGAILAVDTSAAAAAAAGGRGGESPAPAAAAADQPAQWHLPHLQVLEVVGRFEEPLPLWLDHLEAPQLTSLQYDHVVVDGDDVISLAACSGLRELVLRFPVDYADMEDADDELAAAFEDLTQLTALTKLVVEETGLDEPVPPGVWTLTQLRHLDFSISCKQQQLPEDISCLKQLTYLGLSRSGLQELPAELGTWLPQLEVLVVEGTRVTGVPPNLSRLTKLDVSGCGLGSIAAIEHLTGLKELQAYPNYGLDACDAISKLTGLEVLSITIPDGAVSVSAPCVLPRLRDLTLYTTDTVRRAAQLVGPGQHLTSLWLIEAYREPEQRRGALTPEARSRQDEDQAQAFAQLGVLPALQHLHLSDHDLSVTALASRWLQQQPQLTSLRLYLLDEEHDPGEVPDLQQLPAGLRELTLEGNMPLAGIPDVSAQLSSLRVLELIMHEHHDLPGWMSSLTGLAKVNAWGGDYSVEGWRALSPLPLLRQWATKCMSGDMADALSAAPHLCWAQR